MLCPQDRSLQLLGEVTWMCSQGEGKHLCSRAPRKSCCGSCQGTKLLWFQFSRWISRWISPADKLGAGRPGLELPSGTAGWDWDIPGEHGGISARERDPGRGSNPGHSAGFLHKGCDNSCSLPRSGIPQHSLRNAVNPIQHLRRTNVHLTLLYFSTYPLELSIPGSFPFLSTFTSLPTCSFSRCIL